MADLVEAPRLTMPDAEAEAVRDAYAAAEVILEYGTGGSTVIAAGLEGRTVFAVESDARWLARMQAWFDAHPPAASLILHRADIGPTGKWGFPADNQRVRAWAGYPISVWQRADFRHPDVVLVDGRFRLACMLTTLLRIERPVQVLVDDYIDRPGYKAIEALAGEPVMVGRMARFTFTPRALPVADMHWIMAAYATPN